MNIQRSMRAILAAAALFAAAAGSGEAQTIAYADPGTTNLRNGPGTTYAVIGTVRGGTQVYVHNCDYGWCHVTANGRDGWIAQSRLAFAHARAPVVVPGPYYGVPSFGFSLRFGDHSRHRFDRRWRDHHGWEDEDWWWRHRGGGRGHRLD